jgi:hypothetical protein
METTTEISKEKVTTSIRIEADLYAAVGKLADEEDRPSMANMIERLLKTHPRIQTILEPTA